MFLWQYGVLLVLWRSSGSAVFPWSFNCQVAVWCLVKGWCLVVIVLSSVGSVVLCWQLTNLLFWWKYVVLIFILVPVCCWQLGALVSVSYYCGSGVVLCGNMVWCSGGLYSYGNIGFWLQYCTMFVVCCSGSSVVFW